MNQESRIENQGAAAASVPRQVNVANSQVGVIGDYAQVREIHYHVEPPDNPRERRNRAAMLQLVRNTWIKGVLEQSLHGAALLELGMEYNPEAVDHPWDMVVQMPERPDKAVPPGTRIVDVFDELGGSLLILGEPGSGKTTMLLELARDLIARAEQDETLHIPVVFNLSSWAVKQQPLEEWVLEELCDKYHISEKVARAWIEEDNLLLLLDGLDEVKTQAREKCVAAINTFRQAHFIPWVVCSRITDYEVLTIKLHFQEAICLRPLTPAQVDIYLAGAGIEFRAIRATLKHDLVLQEMAQSPLFISIMTLAYRGLTVADLHTFDKPEARRQHLFDTYIQHVFYRRSKIQCYTQQQAFQYLTWLASYMNLYHQTIFAPTYILTDKLAMTTRFYQFICVCMLYALVAILLCIAWPVFSQVVLSIVGVIGLIFVCVGSFKWITGGGNPNSAEMARSYIGSFTLLLAKIIITFLGLSLFVRELTTIMWIMGGCIAVDSAARVAESRPPLSFNLGIRVILAVSNNLPWCITRFLDYCVDRVFLRRVGGGYIFIHRLLMEHFAALTPEDIERLAANAEGGRA